MLFQWQIAPPLPQEVLTSIVQSSRPGQLRCRPSGGCANRLDPDSVTHRMCSRWIEQHLRTHNFARDWGLDTRMWWVDVDGWRQHTAPYQVRVTIMKAWNESCVRYIYGCQRFCARYGDKVSDLVSKTEITNDAVYQWGVYNAGTMPDALPANPSFSCQQVHHP